MNWVISLYTTVIRSLFRLSWSLGRHASTAIQSATLRRRFIRSGTGSYDYRGLVHARRAPASLLGCPLPLGHFLSSDFRRGHRVGLPAEQLRLNACVIGPPGAGKTHSIIVPWIVAAARAGFSVVTLDVKGDLLDAVRAEVGRQGTPLGIRARSIDYTRPQRSARWNWLASIDSDRAIDNAVKSIVGHAPPPQGDPYYFHLDSQILRGVLELVVASPKGKAVTAEKLVRLLEDQDGLDYLLRKYPHSPAVARLRELIYLPPDDFSKRVTGVRVRLDALARPTVTAVTMNPTLTPADLLREQQIVSIVAPLADGQMATTFSSLFINDLLFRVYNRFTGYSGPRILLVLDEAAQLADRVDYQNLLSVARAAGMGVLLALQDTAQFADASVRSVALGNCDTYLSLNGVSHQSAKFLSERLGNHNVSMTSMGQAPTGWGYQTTTTTTTTTVPILGHREIMSIPGGIRPAIVHCRSLFDRPFLVDLEDR